MKQLPNILTLANLFCGSLACIFILQSPSYIATFNGQDYVVTAPESLYAGSILIVLGALLDFGDGLAARLLKASGGFGRQLDSLADILTFGLAPGLILYQLLRNAYMQLPGAINVSMVNLSFALLLPCFGAWRLARFNSERPGDYFRGLPIPAAGLLVASFPLLLLFDPFNLAAWLQNIWILYLIIGLLCYLMVSSLPMMSLKFRNLSWKGNLGRYLFILLSAAYIPLLHLAAVPASFLTYILLSLLTVKKAV